MIVPQVDPLQPTPLTLQLTRVSGVPDTFALKSCVPETGIEALVGLMLSTTPAGEAIVTSAGADLVGSATLVAFTVMFGGEGRAVSAM